MKVELNPDGISVKGCNIIYAPKGQAQEYAPLATNPYWPAPGSEDTELGAFMGPEVSHGEAKVYARV